MSIRTFARLGALPVATAAIALSLVAPASAHVSATVSDASAGAYTIATFGVPHGCEGSPTTEVEIQVPESILSVTPTRNPFYDVEVTMAELDEPVTDSHGNEVTERVASVVYTATTPLPDAQRDALELSFQVPDAAGETLAFPTIQTCQKGETGWVEVPAEGQDPDELESPAPAFEILPASDGAETETETETETEAEPAAADADAAPASDAGDEGGSSALGWAGLVAGLLGLAAGGLALARTRTSTTS